MKNQNLRLSILLGLLICVSVPTYAVAKPLKGNIIFVRGGIVLLNWKNASRGPINPIRCIRYQV